MENTFKNSFQVPTAFMWLLTVVNILTAVTSALNLSDPFNSPFYAGVVFGIMFITMLIFVADAITSDIYNKYVWIIFLVITPMVTYFIYLIQREKLLDLYRKKVKYTGA